MAQLEVLSGPSVSAIIPTYNGAHCVSRAIDSVLNQSFSDVEVIVVDDGSTDATPHVLQQYGSRIMVVRRPNGGIASARNAGIKAASGLWNGLLDHDDLWDRDKLARQVSYIHDHPNVAMVYSYARVRREGKPSRTKEELTGSPLPKGVPQYEGLLMRNVVPPLTTLFLREVAVALDGFRQDLAPADDWDLWLRIAKEHSIGFMPEVLATYRLHADNFHLNNMRRMIEVGNRIFHSRLPEVTELRISREACIQHYCWEAAAWAYVGEPPDVARALSHAWRLGPFRQDVALATLRSMRELVRSFERQGRRGRRTTSS